jgi:ABC-type Fe3+-citrate transport system substrate-binding protein
LFIQKGLSPVVALLNGKTKQEVIMSYYEVARKVQKQKEMEKYLVAIRNATAELERMIHDGENC